MPFTLHFNSRENTELLDISDLEELAIAKCIGANKYNNIVFDKHFNQPIPKLPTFIKNLTFGHNFNQDISGIGDHIESIIFEVVDFNYNLATFPKGLRELKIISDKISSGIENINPGLENLTIQSMTFNDEIKLANTNIKSLKIQSYSFNRSLQELPSGLKSLVINSILFNSSIDNLPLGLELLKITSDIFNQSINNLPPGLKSLILESVCLFQQPLNNLPHGLEYFHFDLGYYNGLSVYKQTLEHLPNSIIKMVLSNFWGDLNTIGDGVVELDIWFPSHTSKDICTHIQHWKKIPSSLKILNINSMNTSLHNKHDVVDIIKTNINCNGICINGIDM